MTKNKLTMLIGSAALAAASSLAHAGLSYSYTRTNSGATDTISFFLTGFTGVDDTGSQVFGADAALNGIGSLAGTYTTTGAMSTPTTNGGFSNGGGVPASPKSYINLDLSLSTPVYGGITGSGGTRKSTSVSNLNMGTLTSSSRIRPVDTSVGADDDGIDETLLSTVYVTAGSNVTFTGTYGTYTTIGGAVTLTTVSAGASLNVVKPGTGTPVTAVHGSGVKYLAQALVGSAGSYTYLFDPTYDLVNGHTLVALDFTGQTAGTPLSTLLANGIGGTDVTTTALLAYFNGATAGGSGSYDYVVDIGSAPSGTLSITGTLPSGVTLSGIAVVPEPTSMAGLALLGVPALARRRRA